MFLKVKNFTALCFSIVLSSVLLPAFQRDVHIILHYQLREVSLIMCLINASSHLILYLSQEECSGFQISTSVLSVHHISFISLL